MKRANSRREHRLISRRVRSFSYGLKLPFRALRLIVSTPSLLAWSLLPVLLTGVLYFFGIRELQHWVMQYVREWIVHSGFHLEGWVGSVLDWTIAILLWIVAGLTFSFTSTILASPFNDLLAERAERFAELPMTPAPPGGFQHLARTLMIDVSKSVAAATATVCALVVSWIPLINFIAFALAFLLLAFQYTSYPQTRRHITLRAGLWFLVTHFWACFGFGATMSLLFAIPLISSFALPVAVVAGTLLVARAPGDPDRRLLPLK